jgi:hypothetical protein
MEQTGCQPLDFLIDGGCQLLGWTIAMRQLLDAFVLQNIRSILEYKKYGPAVFL